MKRVRSFFKLGFQMRFALLSLGLAMCNGALPGQAAGAGWWDEAKAMTVDSQGNVYVTGRSQTSERSWDIATLKYSPAGQQLWVQRLGAPASYYSNAGAAIAGDADGYVYVAGTAYNPATKSYDYATIKYAADGTQIWRRYFNGPGQGDDKAVAIGVDGQGNVYVTGASDGGTVTKTDCATVKYQADGVPLWVRRYNGPQNRNDEGCALVVEAQGYVYITGRTDVGGISAMTTSPSNTVPRVSNSGPRWKGATIAG